MPVVTYKRQKPKQFQEGNQILTRNSKIIDPLLFDLLTQATPHGYEKLLLPIIEKYIGISLTEDKGGNYCVRVLKDNNTRSRTMFSSHLDTVHDNPDKLKLVHCTTPADPKDAGMIYAILETTDKQLKKWHSPEVLGADDKLGIWIMCKLIRNRTPGTYIFHVGEEKGGIGSGKLALAVKDELGKLYDRAIAFDRMNYGDVIAYQRGGRCCSKEFSEALAGKLNDELRLPHQKYSGEVRGMFTDTANYADYIAECTNISVGYFNQHGDTEHFDSVFLQQMLMPALLKIDFDTLPKVRDPKAKAVASYVNYTNTGASHYNQSDFYKPEVAPKDITADMGIWGTQIPKFNPKVGRVPGISNMQFLKMVHKWVNSDSNEDIAKYVCTIYNALMMPDVTEQPPPATDKYRSVSLATHKLMSYVWQEYEKCTDIPPNVVTETNKLRAEIEFFYDNSIDIDPVTKECANKYNVHLDSLVWTLFAAADATKSKGLREALTQSSEYIFKHVSDQDECFIDVNDLWNASKQ